MIIMRYSVYIVYEHGSFCIRSFESYDDAERFSLSCSRLYDVSFCEVYYDGKIIARFKKGKKCINFFGMLRKFIVDYGWLVFLIFTMSVNVPHAHAESPIKNTPPIVVNEVFQRFEDVVCIDNTSIPVVTVEPIKELQSDKRFMDAYNHELDFDEVYLTLKYEFYDNVTLYKKVAFDVPNAEKVFIPFVILSYDCLQERKEYLIFRSYLKSRE